VKVTVTLQELPAEKVLIQDPLLLTEKSSPVAPWVRAWIPLTAVVPVKLKVTENVSLHGAGPVAAAGQTLAVAKTPGAKLALTFNAPFMVTVQVGLVPAVAQAPPPHLTKVDPAAAFAVRVTWAPLA
jgi:hypothetical protein